MAASAFGLAALSLLRGGKAPLDDQELLETTLDHEARYWQSDGLSQAQVAPLLRSASALLCVRE